MKDILGIFLSIFLTVLLLAIVFTSIGESSGFWGPASLLIMMGLGFGLFVFFLYIIDYAFTGAKKTKEVIKEKVKERIQDNQTKKHMKYNLHKYNQAKSSFQFFSDDKLISLFEESSKNQPNEDAEQLALEEELVKRGLIDHSPMHEKLYLQKKKILE